MPYVGGWKLGLVGYATCTNQKIQTSVILHAKFHLLAVTRRPQDILFPFLYLFFFNYQNRTIASVEILSNICTFNTTRDTIIINSLTESNPILIF